MPVRLLVGGSIAAVALVVSALVVWHRSSLQQERLIEERLAGDVAWDAAWSPLPRAKQDAALPLAEVRAAYAFATRRDDVLRFIPCYCGCEHEGHRSNVDCYIRTRSPSGVPEWDAHAFT